MAFVPTTPVLSHRASSARVCVSARASTFAGVRSSRVSRAVAARPARGPRMEFEISEGVPYQLNPLVLGLAAAGWIVPSSIPANIPLTGGAGLSPAFFNSISANLANFPAGPAAADPFWTLCFMWHAGMFATMIFGTIGYNLRMSK